MSKPSTRRDAAQGWVMRRADDRGLPGDLKAAVEQAQRTALAIRGAEAEYAYQLALLAKAARTCRLPDGSSAVTACAHVLGLARTTLTAFAFVAARWTADDLHQLLTLRDICGRPLSVTHLLLVARLPRAMREYWIERVLSEGLDVRSLKRAMRLAKLGNGDVVAASPRGLSRSRTVRQSGRQNGV